MLHTLCCDTELVPSFCKAQHGTQLRLPDPSGRARYEEKLALLYPEDDDMRENLRLVNRTADSRDHAWTKGKQI